MMEASHHDQLLGELIELLVGGNAGLSSFLNTYRIDFVIRRQERLVANYETTPNICCPEMFSLVVFSL